MYLVLEIKCFVMLTLISRSQTTEKLQQLELYKTLSPKTLISKQNVSNILRPSSEHATTVKVTEDNLESDNYEDYWNKRDHQGDEFSYRENGVDGLEDNADYWDRESTIYDAYETNPQKITTKSYVRNKSKNKSTQKFLILEDYPSVKKEQKSLKNEGGKKAYSFAKKYLKMDEKPESSQWEGMLVREREHPYIALIHKEDSEDSCSGFIIADSWILTCSYCFKNYYIGTELNAVKIYAGIATMPVEGRNFQIRTAVGVILNGNNDFVKGTGYELPQLALVKLSESFHFNDYVNYIRLSGPGPFQVSETYLCYIVGFSDGRKKELKWKYAPISNSIECRERYGIELYDRGLCARGTEGRLSCHSDIGAPVICNKLAVGVVTMRADVDVTGAPEFTFDCLDRFKMNIYTFTGSYFSWIKSHVVELSEPGDSGWFVARANNSDTNNREFSLLELLERGKHNHSHSLNNEALSVYRGHWNFKILVLILNCVTNYVFIIT